MTLADNLRRARDLTIAEQAKALGGFMTLPQFQVLQFFVENPWSGVVGLPKKVGMTEPAADGVIGALVGRVWLARRHDPYCLGATGSGRGAYQHAQRLIKEGDDRMLEALAPADRVAFVDDLMTIIEAKE